MYIKRTLGALAALFFGATITYQVLKKGNAPTFFSTDQVVQSLTNLELPSVNIKYNKEQIIKILNKSPLFNLEPTEEALKKSNYLMLCSHGHNSSTRAVHKFFVHYSPYKLIQTAWFGFNYIQKPDFFSAAQEFDIIQLKRRLDAIINLKTAEQKIILWGHSNGSSTIISLLGNYPEYAQHIYKVIVLAPFANLPSVFPKVYKVIGKDLYFNILKTLSARAFDENIKNPLDYFKEQIINKELPILFIHAKDDFIVPYKNMKLFIKACDQNYPHIEFLTLKSGGHSFWVDQEIQEKMEFSITSFLIKHS